MMGNKLINPITTKWGAYSMNEWWFRNVHRRTERHHRNVYLADQIINNGVPRSASPQVLLKYAAGIMRGCGCNILAG